MALRPALAGGKVARRLVWSFVLAALIPLALFGLLSFRQVGQQLADQTASQLRNECKSFALRFTDRLKVAEGALHLLAAHGAQMGTESDETAPHPGFEPPFAGAAEIADSAVRRMLLGALPGTLPALSPADRLAVAAGKTLIKMPEAGRIWMAVAVAAGTPEAGIVIALLKPEFLGELSDSTPNPLWLFVDGDFLWFAADPALTLPADFGSQRFPSSSGRFSWQQGDARYLGAYWRLPLGAMYAASDIVIVQAQATAVADSALRQFRTVFPPVIALALLLIAYLSIKLIGRHLTPLEQLKAATVRLAAGDFDSRVHIRSADEFEALASSFNHMAERLRHQFDILSAMAELDRNILSALTAEDLIESAMHRIPEILACDRIAIARFDPDSGLLCEMRSRRVGGETVIAADPVTLPAAERETLLAAATSVLEIAADSPLQAYLVPVAGDGPGPCLVVPVVVGERLAATLTLGYRMAMAAETRAAARNFGDRIAVALSHAAWQEKLYRQAHYDALTGLPNRLVLLDRLEQERVRAQRDGSEFAVLFIDLDRFKNINDSLGHGAGDELLVAAAGILTHCIRATDLVVRMGGDEFVMVLTDLHPGSHPVSLVTNMAEKVLAAMKQPLTIVGHSFTVTASIGIAIFPVDAESAADLLRNSDAAMYHAKQEGRANLRFYSPELNASALENIELEQDLRVAVRRGELLLHYQPKVEADGRVVGAEALVRWLHPSRGLISPAVFIRLAEQTGLIVEIGEWVLTQVCLYVTACRAAGLRPLPVAVNVSAIEFRRPELPAKVAAILAETGADPAQIELELTESVAVGDIAACIDRMNTLKAMGLSIAMDDFGTGFSSLSYIKQLPLDVLKIDQSFVRQMEAQTSSQAIVRAILALAEGLGLAVVAEGVETRQQLEFLTENGCRLFQGYLFSRPLPAAQFQQRFCQPER